MIHKNSVVAYRETLPKAEVDKLTLETLKEKNPDLYALFEKSFATIGKDATIEDAKRELDRVSDCQDIFITENGKRNAAVLGWLSNTRLMAYLNE